jgi:outer membrane usher protein
MWTQKSQWKANPKLTALLVSSLFALAPHAATAQDAAPGSGRGAMADGYDEALLAVDVNDQRLDTTLLALRDKKGVIYLSRIDLQRLRLRAPAGDPVQYKGAAYYSLAAFPGANYKLDEATQSLSLRVSPEAFLPTIAGADTSGAARPTRPSPGMFFNYDLLAQHSAGLNSGAGLFELGAFNSMGVGVANFEVQRGAGIDRTVRLDTTLTIDRPERMASLRLGDAISRPASGWGTPVRFGGVQYATNFNTQPGFFTQPLQSFTGQAALPSTTSSLPRRKFRPGRSPSRSFRSSTDKARCRSWCATRWGASRSSLNRFMRVPVCCAAGSKTSRSKPAACAGISA